MEADLKLIFSFFVGGALVFKVTKHNYILEKRLELLENNLRNLKERTSDLRII